MADEQAGWGWKSLLCGTSVVVIEGEESITRCLERRWCWEYGSPPIRSLLLGHCCYHCHPYFERRSGPSGFFSLMFLCWWNTSSGFPHMFVSQSWKTCAVRGHPFMLKMAWDVPFFLLLCSEAFYTFNKQRTVEGWQEMRGKRDGEWNASSRTWTRDVAVHGRRLNP